ncbi:MAG: gamma-glutamylcyclotransferase family protein [Halobacteriota archaeon]
MTDYLFVYGTLMRGFGMQDGLGMRDRAEDAGTGKVLGELYDVDGTPALVAEGTDRVHGEVYRVVDDSLVEDVDRYEGYYPDSPSDSLYLRVHREVVDRDLQAWMYVYNADVDDGVRVESGSWREYSDVDAVDPERGRSRGYEGR